MAFYDTGEYFNSSVDNWLDYYDISFYEDSSETLSEMYMSTPSGGDMSIVFDGGSFKKGNYENNTKELERQIYKYCQNDLDDICEPYIEQFSRDKSWFADCGITSYRELIDDIEEWKNTLIDFDNRLLGEIKNLEKDYSKEKFFWIKDRDSLDLPDDVLERWEQFKSNKVARVEKLEKSEQEIETPAEVARKAKEKANKHNANSIKSIDKNKSIKR